MLGKSDEQLVLEYLANNEQSLAILITRHTKSVYHFVARFVGQGAEAEDVTQEAFIKVWKNLRKFDKAKKFRPWLFRIARNVAIDYLRARKQLVDLNKFTEDDDGDEFEVLPDLKPSPFDLLDIKEQQEKVSVAIMALPEIYRTVLDLHLREELTLAEVAETLGEKEDTVKSRYRRGLLRLRKLLANGLDPSPSAGGLG